MPKPPVIALSLLIVAFISIPIKAETLTSAVAWWPYGLGGNSSSAGTTDPTSMMNACLAYKPETTQVVNSPGEGVCGPEPRNVCLSSGGGFLACVRASSGAIDCDTSNHGYCDKQDQAVPEGGCPKGAGGKGKGNPCNVATGNKYQAETDFSSAGLTLIRSYNSLNLSNLSLGVGWRTNYHQSLIVDGDSLTQVSGRGRGEPWSKVDGVWQGNVDSEFTITETPSGFSLAKQNGSVNQYDATGKLLSEADSNGRQTTYSYNADMQLTQVTNHYGHSITFTYLDKNIRSVTDAFGLVYLYEYDQHNNLRSVVFPDDTPAVYADNARKVYHYEDANFPHYLTGITDENGDRYATFAYQADGRAILTEHAQTTNAVGQEKIQLGFQ